jgi:UDP-N-acetylmuramate dehydrogenase
MTLSIRADAQTDANDPSTIDALKIRPQVSLANFTTWKVGGLAEWLVEPTDLTQTQAAIAWARSRQLPVTFLGAGSNLLISDRGLPGLIVITRHLRWMETEFDRELCQIKVGAGKMIGSLAWQAARKGWTGLEWAAGIPGTVGGAVVMNAGAHGSSMENVLVTTRVLSIDGELVDLAQSALEYSYRHSNLQNSENLVVSATMQLQVAENAAAVVSKTQNDLERRHTTQPYDRPSCGSVFRNPLPQFSAKLIEDAGLKGFSIGGAEVSQLHANFIINRGDATAMDIFRLIAHVKQQVQERWTVDLETEVKMMGEFSAP